MCESIYMLVQNASVDNRSVDCEGLNKNIRDCLLLKNYKKQVI